ARPPGRGYGPGRVRPSTARPTRGRRAKAARDAARRRRLRAPHLLREHRGASTLALGRATPRDCDTRRARRERVACSAAASDGERAPVAHGRRARTPPRALELHLSATTHPAFDVALRGPEH